MAAEPPFVPTFLPDRKRPPEEWQELPEGKEVWLRCESRINETTGKTEVRMKPEPKRTPEQERYEAEHAAIVASYLQRMRLKAPAKGNR